MLVESLVPLFLTLALATAGIWLVLKLFLGFLEIPNYTTSSPSPFYRWWHLAPADILFRLASLAALNLVLYWMPIYYWTTYQPSGDERDGGVLGPAMVLSPLSWILGGFC